MQLRTRAPRAWMGWVAGVWLVLGLTACTSQPPANEPQAEQAPPTESPAAQEPARHALNGKVVSIDKPGKSLVVDHGEIPGFMQAMTMPYPVKDETLLDKLSPGDPVNAEVVVDSSGSMWLENIVVAPNPAP